MADKEYVGELSEVLEALGEQLREANRKITSKAEGAVIGLDSATITLETTIMKDANGGLRLWVVNAGVASQEAKTVKVEVHARAIGLDPANPTDTRLEIGQ